MAKKYSVVIAIMTLLLSACCPMVSVNPLSSPAGLDKRLEGVWEYNSKEDDEVYLHIGKKSENKMTALSVEHKGNGKLDIIEIPFSLTKTSSNSYLNVNLEDLEKEASEGSTGFIFLKYVLIDNSTLLLYQLDREFIVSAIQSKKLAGKITYKKKRSSASEKTVDCVVITDTSANILAFIESSKKDALFSNEMKFVRLK